MGTSILHLTSASSALPFMCTTFKKIWRGKLEGQITWESPRNLLSCSLSCPYWSYRVWQLASVGAGSGHNHGTPLLGWVCTSPSTAGAEVL